MTISSKNVGKKIVGLFTIGGSIGKAACAAALLSVGCAGQVDDGAMSIDDVEDPAPEVTANVDPRGEQTKDPHGAVQSQMSTEDRKLLSSIAERVRSLKVTQEKLNELSDSFAFITDTHDYLIALDEALSEDNAEETLADLGGSDRSLAYAAGASYPSRCFNQSVQYEVQIGTDGRSHAGTDANVFVKWRGKYLSTTSSWSIPYYLDTPANDFEAGSTFDKTFYQVSSGDIVTYNLYHDNTGNKPGWFPQTITFYDWCSRRLYTSGLYLWLAADEAPLYSTSFTGTNLSEAAF